MGVLSAALTKCTTAIFGKSYDAMKQDERKADKKKQEKYSFHRTVYRDIQLPNQYTH